MPETALLYTGAVGLNTVKDPTRSAYNPESGVSDLGVAVNITISDTGYASRRSGYNDVVTATEPHSMFCDGNDCLYIVGANMYQLLPDYSSVLLKSDISLNRRMSYAQVNSDIYYTNEVNLGIIRRGGIVEAWEASTYVGPDTNRTFDGPRAGRHIAFYAGRIFVFEENILWWSEPFAFSWFDRTRNYLVFPTNGRMIKPVGNGIFVSDEENTYFLSGQDPKEFTQDVVSTYPVVEWSDAIDYVDGVEIGLTELGQCALWASFEGACLGTSNGSFINLNKKKVIYPEYGTQGAGLLMGYNYIHSIGV